MARMDEFDGSLRDAIEGVACPTFDNPAWTEGPPLPERRVAILSTAALQKRDGASWNLGDSDYRVISSDVSGNDLVMSHYSVNFDRTGFQQDVNVVFLFLYNKIHHKLFFIPVYKLCPDPGFI